MQDGVYAFNHVKQLVKNDKANGIEHISANKCHDPFEKNECCSTKTLFFLHTNVMKVEYRETLEKYARAMIYLSNC